MRSNESLSEWPSVSPCRRPQRRAGDNIITFHTHAWQWERKIERQRQTWGEGIEDKTMAVQCAVSYILRPPIRLLIPRHDAGDNELLAFRSHTPPFHIY